MHSISKKLIFIFAKDTVFHAFVEYHIPFFNRNTPEKIVFRECLDNKATLTDNYKKGIK